jgi:L-ascorbate metabolism protein UlaG (beta-lactamase superfamily)
MKSLVNRIVCCSLVAVLSLLIGAGGFAVFAKKEGIDKYSDLVLPPVNRAQAPNPVRATFFGVSSILLDDGKSSILIDGFFSRPGRGTVILGKLKPDVEEIKIAIARGGIKNLGAVVVSHSHYDHAMDCAEIAKQTGALVIGSESTANVARGDGLSENRIRVMHNGSEIDVGNFHITFIESVHAPSGAMKIAGGDIEKPLKPPAHAINFQEGGTFSILVRNGGENILVQSSAGFVNGALKGRSAPIAFLGVGLLGKQNEKFRENYWAEVVRSVGAKRVILVHWDDFMRPLDKPLVLAPRPFDEVEKAIAFVLEAGKRDGVDVKLPPLWTPFDPAAGL